MFLIFSVSKADLFVSQDWSETRQSSSCGFSLDFELLISLEGFLSYPSEVYYLFMLQQLSQSVKGLQFQSFHFKKYRKWDKFQLCSILVSNQALVSVPKTRDKELKHFLLKPKLDNANKFSINLTKLVFAVFNLLKYQHLTTF